MSFYHNIKEASEKRYLGHKYLRDDSEANPDKNRVNKRDEEKEENHY